MKNKVSLVLEGGGMRGAYTAGCLDWLLDSGIEFDAHYGISTGAIHLVSYLLKSKHFLHEMACKLIADKSAIGWRAFLREGTIAAYDYQFSEIMGKKAGYPFDSIKDIPANGNIGLYDLELGRTDYLPLSQMNMEKMKAACSLPVIAKVVKSDGHEYLDGGITEMIPIEQAIKDGNTRHLVVATKPNGYIRKPSSGIVVAIMRLLYPKCPNIANDYKIRHLNYKKEIDLIHGLVDKKEAIYMSPSESVKVSRLSGDPKTLDYLYQLGYKDMENKKEEIYALFK